MLYTNGRGHPCRTITVDTQVIEVVQLAGAGAGVRVTCSSTPGASSLEFAARTIGGVSVFRVRFATSGGVDGAWHCSDCLDALRAYGVVADSTGGERPNGPHTSEANTDGAALDNMVRLCLLDDTFPDFVGRVDKALAAAIK